MVFSAETAIPIAVNIRAYTLAKYVPAKLAEPTLEVVFNGVEKCVKQSSNKSDAHGQLKCAQLIFPFARSAVMEISVKEANTLVTGSRDSQTKRVLEIMLDSEHTTDLDYQPGDTIAILPSNSEFEVQQLLHALKLEEQADSSCQLQVFSNCTKKNAKVPPHIPTTTTPRELLRDCINVRSVLKKQLLRALAECCTDTNESDFLNCLSSKEASAYYNELVLEKGLTLIEMLQICVSCRPTLAMLAEYLPRLLPRPYSIANSPLTSSNEIKFIFSVLAQKPGVTTTMLEHISKLSNQTPMAARPKVFMYLRESNKFRYTSEDACSNQILIGIGTGLAPFLGFLEHKHKLFTAQKPHAAPLGQTWLFSGATSEASIPYRTYLLELEAKGVLNKYYESVSRVPDAQFHYVQEQLTAHASDFVDLLLQPETVLYLCADGGAQISKSIEAAIKACLMQELQLQEADVRQMMVDFRSSGKYREDLWT